MTTLIRKPTTWEIRRRSFLKSLGVGLGMIPVLRETRANAAPAQKGRFVVFAKPNGNNADVFWPKWADGRPADGSLNTATLPQTTSPLADFRKSLIFPDGLGIRCWLKSEGNPTGDNGNAHHGWGAHLTGALPAGPPRGDGGCNACLMQAGGPSIDNYLAKQFNKMDPAHPNKAIHVGLLGSGSANGFATASWTDKTIANPRETDPVRVFESLFSGRTGMPVVAGPEGEKRRLEQMRVLDYTFRDIERFRARMGSEDKALTESHLQSVSERRKEIEGVMFKPGMVSASCKLSAPEKPGLNEANTGRLSKIMLDLTFDALRCGVSRSICFTMFDSNAYDTYFTWLKDRNPSFGNNSVKASEFPLLHLHSLAHGGGRAPGKALYDEANKWMIEQPAYLIKRLAAEPEAGGTMLDNTVILYTDMFSSGGGHNIFRVPWFMAGNVGGYFRTGRHINVGRDVAQNGLLVSIATALGVAPPDGVFGDPKFGKGEMPGLKAI